MKRCRWLKRRSNYEGAISTSASLPSRASLYGSVSRILSSNLGQLFGRASSMSAVLRRPLSGTRNVGEYSSFREATTA